MEQIDLSLAIKRGLLLKCPSCGKAKLYARYLRQVDTCPHCGTPWKDYNIADAASWLVMVVVSFIAAPLGTYLAITTDWPTWHIIALSCGVSLLLCLATLPSTKAAFMAWMWAKDARDR